MAFIWVESVKEVLCYFCFRDKFVLYFLKLLVLMNVLSFFLVVLVLIFIMLSIVLLLYKMFIGDWMIVMFLIFFMGILCNL